MSKSWDNSILKKLKGLVGKGLSTAEIGKKLGISKNAVVGKLHRMGWNSGAGESATEKSKKESGKSSASKPVAKKTAPVKPVKSKKITKSTKVPKNAKVATKAKDVKKSNAAIKPSVEPKKIVGRPIANRGGNVHQRIVQHALEMANLKPNQCRWPIGDPDSENFHFCGNPVFVGKPYCYEHCKQAYQFTPPKKK